MHPTDDMKMYLTWTAKNGQIKKRHVYYSGNWFVFLMAYQPL